MSFQLFIQITDRIQMKLFRNTHWAQTRKITACQHLSHPHPLESLYVTFKGSSIKVILVLIHSFTLTGGFYLLKNTQPWSKQAPIYIIYILYTLSRASNNYFAENTNSLTCCCFVFSHHPEEHSGACSNRWLFPCFWQEHWTQSQSKTEVDNFSPDRGDRVRLCGM